MHQKFHPLAAALLFISSGAALATDGYFATGYGVKSQGIGGAGIALPQDGLASATNPAGIALVGNEVDLGLTLFTPDRSAQIVGNGVPGANGSYDGNGTKNFFLPEFGYSRNVSNTTSIGLTVYGNGGMNTDYSNNPLGAFAGGNTGKGGVNLEQLFIAPSVAYKVNSQNSVGLALNYAYQRFSANGLQAFETSTVAPNHLTNQGNDSSSGWGVHLGWTGQITQDLTLGVTWASKIKTGKFSNYSGLFVDGGSFDIPENYGVGLAFKASPDLTLALDYQEIKYSGVASVGNPLANLFAGNPLGSANGPGFGWKDVAAVKVGAIYTVSPDLALRVGYNHSGQPVQQDQTLFNILAPGVVQNHLSLGGSWKTSATGEVSVFYQRAFKTEVHGANSIPVPFGGGEANVGLSENSLGIAYAWKL